MLGCTKSAHLRRLPPRRIHRRVALRLCRLEHPLLLRRERVPPCLLRREFVSGLRKLVGAAGRCAARFVELRLQRRTRRLGRLKLHAVVR